MSALKHVSLIALLGTIGLLCALRTYASPKQDDSLPTMKQQADKVLALGNIQARTRVEVVMRYADRAAKAGKTAEAVKYYEKGLKHFPLDMKRQLACAKAQMALGQKDSGLAKARIIAKMAEDDKLVAAARNMLGLPADTKVSDLEKLEAKRPTVVLVPMGDIDVLLLREAQSKAQEISGLNVIIRKVPLTVPAYKRDLFADMCAQFRKALETAQARNPDAFADVLAQAGTKASDLKKDEVVVRVYRKIIAMSAPDNLPAFDAAVAQTRSSGKQWDANELFNTLKIATGDAQSASVRFIGVTRHDIFTKDTNFVFAQTQTGRMGVFSYRRFMASHTGETINRTRLLKRAVNSILTSCGKVYGIDNCIDPSCPRSYPNSVAEHDSKSEKLCQSCGAAFDNVLGKH